MQSNDYIFKIHTQYKYIRWVWKISLQSNLEKNFIHLRLHGFKHIIKKKIIKLSVLFAHGGLKLKNINMDSPVPLLFYLLLTIYYSNIGHE